jgi:hypothetical protein
MGLVPRIHTFRKPFFSRTVVMVAVETPDRAASVAESMVMKRPISLMTSAIDATMPPQRKIRPAEF